MAHIWLKCQKELKRAQWNQMIFKGQEKKSHFYHYFQQNSFNKKDNFLTNAFFLFLFSIFSIFLVFFFPLLSYRITVGMLLDDSSFHHNAILPSFSPLFHYCASAWIRANCCIKFSETKIFYLVGLRADDARLWAR